VSDEPVTNAAVEWLRDAHALMNRREKPPPHTKPDGFIAEDRRTRAGGTNFGRLDGENFEAYYNLSWEFGNQRPHFSITDVHAVGGQSLAVVTEKIDYRNDMYFEGVIVIEFDPVLRLHRRSIVFDLEDVDAAIEELDRLLAEGQAPGAEPLAR
jgi:hypothetical protein